METGNQKRARLLGEPFGSASSRLRKMLLFALVQELGVDTCYWCQKPIENIETFSIEHTIPWQGAENPRETFFDLGHISFSHLGCNSAHGHKYKGQHKPNTLHGVTMYDDGCRCAICKKAHSLKGRSWKRATNYRNINKALLVELVDT